MLVITRLMEVGYQGIIEQERLTVQGTQGSPAIAEYEIDVFIVDRTCSVKYLLDIALFC